MTTEAEDKEFDSTLQRIHDGVSEENPTPAFDPRLHLEHVDDCRHGRKIEDYKQCLEKIGFVFLPKERLPPWADGLPKSQGEWRYRRGDLRLAMTEDDICSWFSGPEELWRWMQNQLNAEKIQAERAARTKVAIQVPR